MTDTSSIKLFLLAILRDLEVQYCGSMTPNMLRYLAYFHQLHRPELLADDFAQLNFTCQNGDINCQAVDDIIQEMINQGLAAPEEHSELSVTYFGRTFLAEHGFGMTNKPEYSQAVHNVAAFSQGFEGPYGGHILATAAHYQKHHDTDFTNLLYTRYPEISQAQWNVALERVETDLIATKAI
jgi:hypothetical protein